MAVTILDEVWSVASQGGASSAYSFALKIVENSYNKNAKTVNATVTFSIRGNSGYRYSSTTANVELWAIKYGSTGSWATWANTPAHLTGTYNTLSSSYTWYKMLEWTGDIPYESDGTLKLSVRGAYTPVSATYMPVKTEKFIYDIPMTSQVFSIKIPIKIGNEIKDSDGYVLVDGEWKLIESAYVNVNSTWKEVN